MCIKFALLFIAIFFFFDYGAKLRCKKNIPNKVSGCMCVCVCVCWCRFSSEQYCVSRL